MTLTHDEAADIEKHLIAGLDRLIEHWAALLSPGSSGGAPGGPSSDPITALDRRVSLAHEVTLALNGWCRIVVEEQGLTHWLPLGTDATGMAVFLRRHARWMSGHEAGKDCSDELSDWSHKVRTAATPQRREWLYLGDCPFALVDPEDGVAFGWCSGQVRWYDDGARETACTECGTWGPVDWWMEVLNGSKTIPADDLADFIRQETGKRPSETTVWRIRKALTPIEDDEGRLLLHKNAILGELSRRGAA